jgi:hypothetical protein
MARTGIMHHVETAEYLNGFAAALAEFHRRHGEAERVCAIMDGEGVNYLMLMGAAGAEPEDLIEIAKCIRER